LNGRVDESLRALVDIAIRRAETKAPTIVTAWIDTAFNGFLVFAMNSAIHSYLILAYADSSKVAMSVGFYYMANACGRLAGTVFSGILYQFYGLVGCLWACVGFAIATGLLSRFLPVSGQHEVPLNQLAAGE